MPTSPDQFDANMDAWRRQQATPWMQLGYRIVQTNLARHLPPGALRVLDGGGGSGAYALPLAAAGHQVTIADYSPAMLADASEAAERAGLGERLVFSTSTCGATLWRRWRAGSTTPGWRLSPTTACAA